MKLELRVLLPLLAVAALGWYACLVPGHPWGDDWAGYVLQARALVDGRVTEELATNSVSMRVSDVQIGPDAYPWGLPMLLALVGIVSNWSIEAMKVIGLASALLLIVATYGLARIHLRPAYAATVAVLGALQPVILLESAYIGSDYPFVAIATLALALTVLQQQRALAERNFRAPMTIAIGILAVAAFAMRSNGAVVPVTYGAMLGLVLLRDPRLLGAAVRDGLLFGAIAGALGALYWFGLPDGSLSHAAYLSFDPMILLQRLGAHVNYLWSWFPFTVFRGVSKIVPLLPFALLIGLALVRRTYDAALLVIYALAHLALLTLFPFDGGPRYYFPLLAPAFVLFGLGLQEAWFDVRERWSGARNTAFTSSLAIGAPALLAVGLVLLTVRENRVYREQAPDAPFGSAMQDIIGYVARHSGADARIGFFKPRAFRLLGQRNAFAISQPGNLDRVDWYVYNNGNVESKLQTEERALTAPGSRFRRAYESGPFRVYVKETSR